MNKTVRNICMTCGRMFTVRKGYHAFCSLECKKRYGNKTFYRCSDCHTLPCTYRNITSNTTPKECPNYKWRW